MRIQGAGALVVGGASGLGEATVRELHARGAQVLIADLDADRGADLATQLGERTAFAAVDVTQPESLGRAVEQAVQAPGGLRIAVNCAGIGHAERIARPKGPHRPETFARVIAVNLVGTFHVLSLASTAMLANAPVDGGGRGVIVTTASIAAYEGQIGQIAYAASKGGVVAMTLPAARDLAGSGIRVCAIAPGLFETPLLAGLPADARTQLAASIPFPPRLGHPPEFAQLACHVVENEMLNGEVIRLDGALRMAPR